MIRHAIRHVVASAVTRTNMLAAMLLPYYADADAAIIITLIIDISPFSLTLLPYATYAYYASACYAAATLHYYLIYFIPLSPIPLLSSHHRHRHHSLM